MVLDKRENVRLSDLDINSWEEILVYILSLSLYLLNHSQERFE